MEVLDSVEGVGDGVKCFSDKGCVAAEATGIADDLSVEKIGNGANVGPSLIDANIGQIGYDDFQWFAVTEFSVEDVAYFLFVFPGRVVSVFCFGVDGYQVKLLHDGANSSPGGDDVFCF